MTKVNMMITMINDQVANLKRQVELMFSKLGRIEQTLREHEEQLNTAGENAEYAADEMGESDAC